MIIVADSGSTKTDCRIIDEGKEILQVKTKGINPYYMTSQEVGELLEREFENHQNLNIDQVFFYGSGCSSDSNKQIIRKAFASIYPNVVVAVEHDLMAAARSLCGHERGIACILGTGSNSALYDGNDIIENVPSLGYILGDEGSGNHLGRKLVQAYYKNKLSSVIKTKFDQQFGFSIGDILENIYKKDMPVRFFAQFSGFIYENLSDPSIHDLVYQSFSSFIVENIERYTGYQLETIHFTGSVAYYYKDILSLCCQDYGLQLGSVVKEPIDGLLSFHGVI